MQKEKSWYVYILECMDGSFYTGISNEELAESDKAVNMQPVGDPLPQEPKAEEHNIRNLTNLNGSFFGMIWNSTLRWIIQERANNKLNEGAEEITFDDKFEDLFEYFWKKATEKRKEKLK